MELGRDFAYLRVVYLRNVAYAERRYAPVTVCCLASYQGLAVIAKRIYDMFVEFVGVHAAHPIAS
jgi:hypothetical protein